MVTSKFSTGTSHQGAETKLLVCVFESFLCQNTIELYYLGKKYLKAVVLKKLFTIIKKKVVNAKILGVEGSSK